MKIGDITQVSIDKTEDNAMFQINKHIKNAYLYRLDTFLTEYKKNLHFNIRCKNIKNIENQRKKILKIDKKIFELQFAVPFIHLNIDTETRIENQEFKINKSVNIMILEDEINSSNIEVIKLSHEKLTNYLKLIFEDKRKVNMKKNIILANVSILTNKDYLAYSYLYKLNKFLETNNKFSCNIADMPNIPGLIFKSTIHKKFNKNNNFNEESMDIIIDIPDILKASENELQHAHKILSNNYMNK